jgi:hypothetical protein
MANDQGGKLSVPADGLAVRDRAGDPLSKLRFSISARASLRVAWRTAHLQTLAPEAEDGDAPGLSEQTEPEEQSLPGLQ